MGWGRVAAGTVGAAGATIPDGPSGSAMIAWLRNEDWWLPVMTLVVGMVVLTIGSTPIASCEMPNDYQESIDLPWWPRVPKRK